MNGVFIHVEHDGEIIVIAADSIAHARFSQWATHDPRAVVILKQRGLAPSAKDGQFVLVNTRYEFTGPSAKAFWDQFQKIFELQ